MDPNPPFANGATAPTLEECLISNPKSIQQSTTPPTSTPPQSSSSSAKLVIGGNDKMRALSGPNEKGKALTGPTDKGKTPATSADKGKSLAAPSTKNSKAIVASAKKRKLSSRKPDANKVAGIQTRKRSIAWDHFEMVPEEEVSEPTAECIHCGHRFRAGTKEHGTSNLLTHIKKCPKYAHTIDTDPRQKILEFDKMSTGKQLAGSVSHAFDQKECRRGIAFFVICDEQPFKVVEGFGFQYMCKRLCPRLDVPTRKTVATDCHKIYMEEKDRLKALLNTDCVRVCLTTDCWTSVQNLNYLCLTAHFIDNEWNYQKRILNFCLVPNHKGETIGKTIEACLNEWGLKRVFTITVDNASSNDGLKFCKVSRRQQ